MTKLEYIIWHNQTHDNNILLTWEEENEGHSVGEGSAIDISTWGVRKCIGGVALLSERLPPIESPLSLQAPLVLILPQSIPIWFFGVLKTHTPGLSRSIPCLKIFKKIIFE